MMEKTEKKPTESKESIYQRLSKIDVKPYLNNIEGYTKKTHKYFRLSYLSWAKAWGLVKAIYPEAKYEIKEYPNWQRTADGKYQQVGTLDYRITSVGCEVQVTVTIGDQKFTQKLYPMDRMNNPILKPNIKDINKAQLRCLVKALATAGLGLNVYAGEDLPSTEDETAHRSKPEPREAPHKVSKARANYRIFTEKELENYKIKFDKRDTLIGMIYLWATKGNPEAQKLWKTKRKEVGTEDGQALLQYEQLAKRLSARSAAKQKQKKESANKTQNSRS